MTRAARHGDFWKNAANTETLKRLWRDGLSAGQIVERLGCSRDAVAARLKRLGLRRNRKLPTAHPPIVAIPKRPDPPHELNRVVAVVRRPTPPRPLSPPTKAELQAMLAQAVRNTARL